MWSGWVEEASSLWRWPDLLRCDRCWDFQEAWPVLLQRRILTIGSGNVRASGDNEPIGSVAVTTESNGVWADLVELGSVSANDMKAPVGRNAAELGKMTLLSRWRMVYFRMVIRLLDMQMFELLKLLGCG